MKRKFPLLLIALLLPAFYGCVEQQDLVAPKNPIIEKAASSASSSHFPLFQLFLYKTNEECDQKVNSMIDHFFYNSSTKIYVESGTDMAYIHNVQTGSSNNDVRSEGMSYGMMICVQLNMKTEFDKLWKWAKTYMLHTMGDRTGYFAWRCQTNGTKIDDNPAPDGEEYFAAALYFAHNRWGSSGTHNYEQDADNILTAMLAPHGGDITPMFGSNNLVVFQPYLSGANYSDPSYHLPAFYELFAEFGPSTQSSRWNQIADASRAYLKMTIEKNQYGLTPDYADFNGNPTGGDHEDFRYDAWRTIMNVIIDNTFFSTEAYADYGTWDGLYFSGAYANKLLSFMESKNNPSTSRNYGDRYELNGNTIGTDHSSGLVAMNAVGARFSNQWAMILRFANELWNLPMPTGEYRYYNGCLYMFAMLYCTGNYNVYDTPNIIRPLKFVSPPIYTSVSLSSQWSGKHLTVTSTQNDAETKAQPENTGWTSQDWVIENVDGSNAVRLKNVWSGKYLNVQNQNENAKVVCYDLNPSWTSMQWRMEPVPGTANQVRIKNVWSGRYLTVENTGNYANIWAQSLNTSWPSQKWNMQ